MSNYRVSSEPSVDRAPPPTAPGPPKPRLLLISATYGWEEPRKKLAALADHFELTCLTSRRFVSALGTETRVAPETRFPSRDGTGEYLLVGLEPTGRPASTTKYFLRGLTRAVAAHPADLILVESEPWAMVRWQSWQASRRHQPRAVFGEFSWENTTRTGPKGRVLAAIYGAAVRTADFVIVGNAGAGEIFRRHGLGAERLLVSPQLGVDEALFHPPEPAARARVRREQFGLPEDGFIVGYAGRLEASKGLRALLAAVEQVRARVPGANVSLCLMGSGSLGAEFARRAKGDAPWLRLLPPATHAEVAAFMQGIDLFVLPSEETCPPAEHWKEQFGHVLIEAMACGTPTLGSDSGAIPEVLDGPGMIYPWRKPECLTARLAELAAMPPAARAEIGRMQRQHTLARYTNPRLAADWAAFLRGHLDAARRASPAPGQPPRVCVLGDQCILQTSNRPRRFLDHFQAEAEGEVEVHYMIAARDDEALQRKFRFLKTPRARAYLSYALAPWHTLRSLLALRRAEFICCEGPHYFWMLVFLNRLGIFPVRGRKAVWCLFFPHSRFMKKLGLLNASPTGFRPFFITREQVRFLEARGAAPGRIRLLDWKVDTTWFHPTAAPTRDFILCPGNIHRDEGLIAALVGRLGLPLVRAGRMNYLRKKFAPFAGRRDLRVEINLDHQAYRRLVQNAAVVLLPIEPCDEPAGLTAALEALACRTPILANRSLGVGPLLERVGGPGILLPDLALETWCDAIQRTVADQKTGGSPLLDAGRRLVEQSHAIESEKQDWRDFVRQATL